MKLIASAGATCVAVWWFAAPAGAHSHLVHTLPANASVVRHAVRTIKLHFDEPVEKQFARYEVRRAGRVVASGALRQTVGTEMLVKLASPLRRGTYVARYRVVSGDGHPVAGRWTFTIRPSRRRQ